MYYLITTDLKYIDLYQSFYLLFMKHIILIRKNISKIDNEFGRQKWFRQNLEF